MEVLYYIRPYFGGYIPLHSPYTGLTYGRYLQSHSLRPSRASKLWPSHRSGAWQRCHGPMGRALPGENGATLRFFNSSLWKMDENGSFLEEFSYDLIWFMMINMMIYRLKIWWLSIAMLVINQPYMDWWSIPPTIAESLGMAYYRFINIIQELAPGKLHRGLWSSTT